MTLSRPRRMPLAIGVAAAAVVAGSASSGLPNAAPAAPAVRKHQFVERALMSQGSPSKEGEEARIAAEQFAFARQAPGVVAPGAYDAAWAQMRSLPTYAGSWSEKTSFVRFVTAPVASSSTKRSDCAPAVPSKAIRVESGLHATARTASTPGARKRATSRRRSTSRTAMASRGPLLTATARRVPEGSHASPGESTRRLS